jgi:hypothetical protein
MRIWIAVLCWALWSMPTLAGTLSEQEVAKLKSDIVAMYDAFEQGEPGLLIASTHESVYPLMGGKEGFEKQFREVLEQMVQLDVKFLSSEVGTPTQTYPAGDEEVCFVPRISVMEIQGKKAKDTGFMIAIRRAGSSWKFLDGSALRKAPEVLELLLPKLTTDLKLPPNRIELL